MTDWLLGLAFAGLVLAPILPAAATPPLCTADGRQQAPAEPSGHSCHALCERRRAS
ncbi:hypothetical protein [Thermaurantiacus sp.]